MSAAILADGRWSVEVIRSVRICALRFGFGGPAQSLEEIGDAYGLTRERIRQIVARVLRRAEQGPFIAAFRRSVEAVLDERDCVSIEELARLSPWFGAIDARGLRILLDAFFPGWAWDGHVSILPRADFQAAIKTMYKAVDAIRNAEDAASVLERLALETATLSGRPRFARTLAALARRRLMSRRRTFAEFVRAFVEESAGPVRLADLREAAERGGFEVSIGQARNTLALCDGVFPLGGSAFGTFEQLFAEPSPGLDSVARRAEQIVRAEPNRQFHVDELLEDVRQALPCEAASVRDSYRLAALLRTRTTLVYLGRFIFAAGAHEARLELAPLARRVLEEAGRPLPLATLLFEMRKYRGVAQHSIQAVLAQLVQVNGIWGLPGRDDLSQVPPSVDPSGDSILNQIVIEDAFAALRPGDMLSVHDLRVRLIERGSEEAQGIEPGQLRALLATNERFCVSPRGFITLSEPRLDEQEAS